MKVHISEFKTKPGKLNIILVRGEDYDYIETVMMRERLRVRVASGLKLADIKAKIAKLNEKSITAVKLYEVLNEGS